MSNITLPDFEVWADVLYYNHTSVHQVREALKQAFEQGRALGLQESMEVQHDAMRDAGYAEGYRDAIEYEESLKEYSEAWWATQDGDEAWYDSHNGDED